MSDPGDSGPPDSGGHRPGAARAERLAAALRANLRRRKAQARERRAAADPADGTADARAQDTEDGPTGACSDAGPGTPRRAAEG